MSTNHNKMPLRRTAIAAVVATVGSLGITGCEVVSPGPAPEFSTAHPSKPISKSQFNTIEIAAKKVVFADMHSADWIAGNVDDGKSASGSRKDMIITSGSDTLSGDVQIDFYSSRAGYKMPGDKNVDGSTVKKRETDYVTDREIIFTNPNTKKYARDNFIYEDGYTGLTPETQTLVTEFLRDPATHISEVMTNDVGLYDTVSTEVSPSSVTLDLTDASDVVRLGDLSALAANPNADMFVDFVQKQIDDSVHYYG